MFFLVLVQNRRMSRKRRLGKNRVGRVAVIRNEWENK